MISFEPYDLFKHYREILKITIAPEEAKGASAVLGLPALAELDFQLKVSTECYALRCKGEIVGAFGISEAVTPENKLVGVPWCYTNGIPTQFPFFVTKTATLFVNKWRHKYKTLELYVDMSHNERLKLLSFLGFTFEDHVYTFHDPNVKFLKVFRKEP